MAGGNGRLRSVDDLIAPDVAETVRNLPDLTDADAAAVKLAIRYARTIDAAAQLAADLAVFDVDEDNAKRLYALIKAVDAQTVLDTLGPKLLAVLDSLGATPKARAARKGGAPVAPRQGKLAAIRSARRPA